MTLRPEDLVAPSENNVHAADYDDTVSIPCNVTRDDDTTIVYKWYRDGEEVRSISRSDSSSGTLKLIGVTEDDRGRYECVVQHRAPGVGGQPLNMTVGAVIIGVGGMCEWECEFQNYTLFVPL